MAISQLWSSLRETIDVRSKALAVAKEIHTFDRDAVDTKERVQVRRMREDHIHVSQHKHKVS